MTKANTRSLDVHMLRRLHIIAFTLFLLLFSQMHGNAQVYCPLCPTNGSRDTLPPHIECYTSVTAYLDATGYRYVSPLTPLTLLGDNCPVLTVWASQTRYYCRDIGSKYMTIYAQDSAGNVASCTSRITILDTIRPKVLNCNKDTTFKLSGGECTSPKFVFPTPSVNDNCTGATTMALKSTLPSGSNFPTGISTVLFEGTDAAGIKSTCSFKVTVSENVATAGSLLCVGSLDIGIGTTCQTTLTARDILSGTNIHCLADYRLAITYNSTTLTNNIISGNYIGKTLRAQVTDLQTNNGCIATLNIRDLSAPRIAPPADIEVSCAQTTIAGSPTPSISGQPTVLADCSPTTSNYVDLMFDATACTGNFTAAPLNFPSTARFDATKGANANRIIVREFTVTDISQNASKTQQVIYVQKTDLTLAVAPPDITVQCTGNGVNTLPDSALVNGVWMAGTGRPTFANGTPLSSGGCKIGAAYRERLTNNATGYINVRTWILTNLCTGETRTVDQFITVNNVPPVIACKTNYVASIPATTRFAKVPASDVVASLTDNCTPLSNLMVRMQRVTGGMPWPDSTELTFNCNDTGRINIEVLVKDPSGLMSKCQTTIQVSDPNSVCRAPTQPAIFGIIETEEQRPIVANVQLTSNINTTMRQFVRSSSYSFLGMPRGDDLDLTPSRDSDVLNGITTFDIALMSRHILDAQPLTSALKLIAADVNADGSVDALDMVITRRMVLRQMDAFPANKSWRFVPKVYQFPLAARTIPALTYPEYLAFVNIRDTIRTADFWAVKTGDLNGSATGNSFSGGSQVEVRGGANPLTINATNEFLEKDKVYDIDMTTDKMDAEGFQFTLNYDRNTIKMLSIEQGDLSNFNHTNYALFPSEGKATVSWNGSLDSKASPMNLFRLRLSAKQSVRLRDVLRLTSDLTPAEAFSSAGVTRSVELTFKGVQTNDFMVFQNEPNPTVGGTTNIRFRLPEASEARLTLYDVSGKILKVETNTFEKGDNNWRISTPPLSGVILYRLDTPTHSATRRMMIGD